MSDREKKPEIKKNYLPIALISVIVGTYQVVKEDVAIGLIFYLIAAALLINVFKPKKNEEEEDK